MAYNHQVMFAKIARLLSANPALRLNELAQKLGCSHPVIENSIRKNTSLSFRNYKKIVLLKRARHLYAQGKSMKYIGLELGYKWPENFSRFVKKSTGNSFSALSLSEIEAFLIMSHKIQ